MSDLAQLQIKLEGAKDVVKELGSMEKAARRVQKATDGIFKGTKQSATSRAMQSHQKQMAKVAQSYKEADAAAQAYWSDIRKNASKVETDLKQLKKANVAAFDREDARLFRKELGANETALRKLRGKIPDEQFNKLQHEISQSRRELNKLNDTSKRAASGFSRLSGAMAGIAAGGAAVAGIAYMGKQLLETTAQLKQSAAQANMTVESYQKLQHVATQYTITQDALIDGLKELNLRADEWVVTGAGPAAEAFERLGYSQKELNKQLNDTPALLNDVIKRMQGLDKAAQIRIADELFGGSGGEQFVAMINDGSKSVAELTKEAEKLGLVMDSNLVDSAVEANRALDTTFRILKTNLTRALITLTPHIVSIAESFGQWATNISNVMDKLMPIQLMSLEGLRKEIEATEESIDKYEKKMREGGKISGAWGSKLSEARDYLEELRKEEKATEQQLESFKKAMQAGTRTFEGNTEANKENADSLANWLTQQELLTSAVTMWDTFKDRSNDNICNSTGEKQSKSSNRHNVKYRRFFHKDNPISTHWSNDNNEWQGSNATEACLPVAA
jgi:DNA repair exonuclease SbcCD ATPase subunit